MSVRSARPSDRPQILTWKRALWDGHDGDDGDETAFVWELPDGSIGGFLSVSLRPWAEGPSPRPRRGRSMGDSNEIGSDARVDNGVSLRAHRAFGFEPTEQLQYFRKQLDPR